MTEATADALAVDGIEAGYFRDVPILNGASLRVGRGEMVTIVGPNGAGKSTLVRVVIGLLEPWAGTVRVDGDDVTGVKPHVVVRRGVGYVAQRDNVFGTMTVLRAGPATRPSAARRCSSCSPDSPSGGASRRGRSPAASARCSRSPVP